MRKKRRRKETCGIVFQSERRERGGREGEEREREREKGEGGEREEYDIIVLSFSFLHGRKSDKDEDAGADKLEVGANETINIFSIASGHLYERFLR